MKTNINKKGFSLVEMLIVIGIIAVMTGTLFATRNNDTASKDVDAAAQQIMAQLRSLQAEALNGRQFDSSGSKVPAYKFLFNIASTNSYNTSYLSYTNAVLFTLAPNVKLKNVSISASTNPSVFLSPLGTTNDNIITVKSTKNTSVKSCVYIQAGGNIKVATCP